MFQKLIHLGQLPPKYPVRIETTVLLEAFILIVPVLFLPFPCNIQKYIAALRDPSQMDGSMPLKTFRWECQKWAGPSFIVATQI